MGLQGQVRLLAFYPCAEPNGLQPHFTEKLQGSTLCTEDCRVHNGKLVFMFVSKFALHKFVRIENVAVGVEARPAFGDTSTLSSGTQHVTKIYGETHALAPVTYAISAIRV